MSDQADKLRILVQTTVKEDTSRRPTVVVVAGGHAGVGVTTVATELAIGLRRQDHPVTLVDADLHTPCIAERCKLATDSSIADVLSGNRTVQEVLGGGPAGLQILPGSTAHRNSHITPAAQKRLLDGIGRMGAAGSVVVLDSGNHVTSSAIRFWDAADLVLLVTTSEADAILGAYSAVKLAVDLGRLPPIATVVTRSKSAQIASDVHGRLAVACNRFLGQTLQSAPPVRAGLEEPDGVTDPSDGIPAIAKTTKLNAQFVRFVQSHAGFKRLTIEHESQGAAA